MSDDIVNLNFFHMRLPVTIAVLLINVDYTSYVRKTIRPLCPLHRKIEDRPKVSHC